MAEKLGYWDLHRCAWVDAEPASQDFPDRQQPSDAADSPVPEQRSDTHAPLVAGTPD